MRWLVFAAAAALLLVPSAARACMSAFLPEAVLFDSPPNQVPPGHSVFRVVGSTVAGDDLKLLVRMVEPSQAQRLGASSWLRPEPWSSCATWGRLGSEAFVVARVAGSLEGKTLLAAVTYQRSSWDRFWSFFGLQSYRPTVPATIF